MTTDGKRPTSAVPTMGVGLEFWGDHVGDYVPLGNGDDVAVLRDETGQHLTVFLDAHDAETLYWALLEIVPALRKGRR